MRQGRKVCVEKEYDTKFKEGDEIEHDQTSLNESRRIRSCDERTRKGLMRNFRDGRGVDGNLGNIKMQILTFQGQNVLKAYLEWEKKIKLIYDCHNYFKKKKVKVAIIEFLDYAII